MNYKRENDNLVWKNNGKKLVISPWGNDSLRVREVAMGEVLNTDFALLEQKKVGVQITITDEYAEIKNGKITAIIEDKEWVPTGRISFYNQKGELLLREIGYQGALNLHARKFKSIIGSDNYQITMTFESNPDEKLYGMGQYQQDIFNIKNCNFELAHRNSQASIPFVISSLGYGFLWHNPAIGRASFAKNMTEWYSESAKQLDYWITAADTPKEIEENYAKVTGTVPMMPEYGLGFWQCKLRYYNQKQVIEVAKEYKKREIPIDVIVIDFFHWPKMGDFKFDHEFYPDIDKMVAEFKEMGIELMVSVWPNVDLSSENFQEMKQKGLLVKPERGVNVSMQFGGDSLFFDATNPKAREYVWEKCKKNYYDHDIKIFWLDEAEPEYEKYDFDNYRYHMGSALQVSNIYPQLYSKTFYEGMKKSNQKNIVNLVRCAWAGSQRYGALVWSGDIHSTFEDLRKQISAGLHMGIAGIPWWTTDIGGFHGGDANDEDFLELLIRWFEFGAFSPVMRLHGDRKPQKKLYREDGTSALFTGSDNEIWSFGEKVYEIAKKYINLREKMRPYIRELMKEAHEKGMPVIRTMFFEFPNDKKCWELKDQYMFGNDVLVAPITYKGERKRQVYLPSENHWIEAHTGKKYEGNQTINVDAPLSVIPVYLKNGKRREMFENLND